MPTEILTGPVGEVRAASTASGGTALTTTAAYIQLPLYTAHIELIPRNFAAAIVVKWNKNPWLVVLKTTDNMLTEPIDYSIHAQDSDTATEVDVSSLSTLANGDFLLIGSHLPFRGCWFDMDGTNGAGTATLSVSYYSDTWEAMTVGGGTLTDGTFSTMTFAQDGLVYWTPSANWTPRMLSELYPTMTVKTYYTHVPLYWTRWAVSAALADTTVTMDSIVAANRNTTYPEIPSGFAHQEIIEHGFGGIGCIEALTDLGTANLIVNCATRRGGKFR